MRGKRKQTCSWPIMTHTWFYCDQSCVVLSADALAITSFGFGFLFRYDLSRLFPHLPKMLNSTECLSFILFPTKACNIFFSFFGAISWGCINQNCLLFDLCWKHKTYSKKRLTLLNDHRFPARTHYAESTTTVRHKPASTLWAPSKSSVVRARVMVYPSRQSLMRFHPPFPRLACWPHGLVSMVCLSFSISFSSVFCNSWLLHGHHSI